MPGPDLPTLLYRAVALMLAAPVHEFAHAYVADRLGDPTPRSQGRLTLNPLVHLDPIGSLLLLIFGFGWAKPVQINPANFSDWRRDTITVAAAGPLANITLMFLLGVPYKVGLLEAHEPFSQILLFAISINAMLAIFNLIPIPPLDGSKILVGLLSPTLALSYARLQRYGVWILLLLVATPFSFIVLQVPMQWLVHQATGLMVF